MNQDDLRDIFVIIGSGVVVILIAVAVFVLVMMAFGVRPL